jgi:cGMP-dependent protein kinase
METKSKNSDDEIVMDSDGVLAEISVEQFKEIIGGCLDVVITKNEKIINDKLKQDQMHKTKFFHSLNEFVLIKEMREGVFGPVYLVQHIT